MKFTVRYMLTKKERKSHQKKRILTQYGRIDIELPADPLKDVEIGKRLRDVLNNLVEGWSLSGCHVSEGWET